MVWALGGWAKKTLAQAKLAPYSSSHPSVHLVGIIVISVIKETQEEIYRKLQSN